MKNTISLILILLFFNNLTNAQNSILYKQISIEINDLSIVESIKQIAKNEDINFIYSKNIIETKKRINQNFKAKSIRTILEEIIKNTDLRYTEYQDAILFFKEKKTEYFFTNLNIIDKETGKGIPYAAVRKLGKFDAKIANSEGVLVLKVDERIRNEQIIFSSMTYENNTVSMDSLLKYGIENIYLSQKTFKIDFVKIKEFSVFYSGGNILKSNSNKFTKEQIKAIKKLDFSDKFSIQDIKIESDSDSYYLAKNLYFSIIEAQNDKNLILYTNNENIIEVTSTLAGNENLEVSVDKGKIEGDKGKYSIWIEEIGIVNMLVIAKNAKGKVVETDTVKFQAIEMKPLSAKIFGKTGGLIRKEDILFSHVSNKVELEFATKTNSNDYEVLSFYISKNRNFMQGIKSESNRINNFQRIFIQELKSGDVFYIKDIRVKTPLNNIIRLNTLGFIVE